MCNCRKNKKKQTTPPQTVSTNQNSEPIVNEPNPVIVTIEEDTKTVAKSDSERILI